MKKIFVSLEYPGEAVGRLAERYKVAVFREERLPTRKELLEGAAGSSAIISTVADSIDREFIDLLPDLKIVSNCGVGYENVDVAYATERGVMVTNTPNVLTETTADLAWALIFAVARRVVEADAYGRVRGYVVQPDAPAPDRIDAAAVADAIGSGLLTVVKDLQVKDLYQGAVALTGNGPEQDISRYLAQSEQVPSLLRLAVEMDEAGNTVVAGGLYIELMPGHPASELAQLEERLDAQPALGESLRAGKTPEEMVDSLLEGIDYLVLERRPVAFVCSCSHERSRMALKALSADDILELIVEGEAVVDCHFCHERYVFSANELMAILDEMEADE